MTWFHEDCGGLFEIDRAYKRTVASVYRLRCAKCNESRKEVLIQMPPHPVLSHRDSVLHAQTMLEWTT